MNPTFQGEIQLLGWSESHNGGAKVTFQLADPSDLEPFKAMTVAKGKTAGQRLACVLVEIGEDEQPVPSLQAEGDYLAHNEKAKGGALAKLAGMWCNDPKFWEWINKRGHWPLLIESEKDAAEFVYASCCIESRAELDANKYAETRFHTLIREPYAEYLRSEPAIREAA